DPVAEELLPRAAGELLQFAAEVLDAQNAILIALIDAPHERQERLLAHAVLDHADDTAALVVRHAEQVDDVLVLRHRADARAVVAAADGAVHRVRPVILATNVRQPFQAARIAHQMAILPDLAV